MVVLINLIMEILLQCICMSNHHAVNFKYICQLYLSKAWKNKTNQDFQKLKN